MSEYIPITQELRDLWYGRRVTDDVVTDASLEAHCDIIDALHKSLEKQNEELRKELKERPVACDAEVMAFVDRLRDAAERHEDVTLWGVDYMALHEDADGTATHVGDKIDGYGGERVEVIGVSRYGAFYYSDIEQRIRHIHSTDLHHHHEPTVEDVLREFAQAMAEHSDMYVSEAIDADERDAADEEAIERFAKRLQLADGDDDE